MRKFIARLIGVDPRLVDTDVDAIFKKAYDSGRDSIRFQQFLGYRTAGGLWDEAYRHGRLDAEARCEANRMEFEQAVKEAYFEATN